MPDEQRYNILYRPDLGPERNYRSEAKFTRTPPMPGITPPTEPTPPAIVEELEELEALIPGLPEGLNPVGEIVTVLRKRAQIIKIETELIETLTNPPGTYVPPSGTSTPGTSTPPGVYTPPWSPPSTYIPPNTPVSPGTYIPPSGTTIPGTYIPPETTTTGGTDIEALYGPIQGPLPGSIHTEEIPDDIYIGSSFTDGIPYIPGVPNLVPPSTNLEVSVTTPKTLVQTAHEGYQKDQLDLQKYFLNKMRIALQKYFQHILALTAELGLSELDTLLRDYDGKAVTGVPNNDKHLHDTIIRSQVQRNQKSRLFKKMANTDQTLMHLRNWNVSEKLRERYYGEAYGSSATFIESEANAILRNNRSEYDNGYRLSLYNTYRYLDSAATITEDILSHVLLEAKSKAKLIQDGVDIFKQTEITYQSATQSAVNAITNEEKKEREETAKKDASAEKKDDTKPTAEEIDKANNITDPSPELAPNGGHYSENDIKFLTNQGYTRENAILELSLNAKYASAEDSSAKNKPENKETTGTTEKVAEQSQQKVESVTQPVESSTPAQGTTGSVTNTDTTNTGRRELKSIGPTLTVLEDNYKGYSIQCNYQYNESYSVHFGSETYHHSEYFGIRLMPKTSEAGRAAIFTVDVTDDVNRTKFEKQRTAKLKGYSAEEQDLINHAFDLVKQKYSYPG